MSFDSVEAARIEQNKMINGEESYVLRQCVTCFGCQEYCLYESNPFCLKVELMEKYNSLSIDPNFLESAIKRNEPHEELLLKEINPNKPVFNKCIYGELCAKHIQGELFKDLQFIGGIDYYCNYVYHHYGKASVTKQKARQIVESIKKQGIKEMIGFYELCYQLYSKFCPENNIEVGFKVIPLSEYLFSHLKNHKSRINKLTIKNAYQRLCSSLIVPEMDEWVDKICNLIGVERLNRKFNGQNALCCTGFFTHIGKKKLTRKAQNDNITDIVNSGAETYVYN